ncbi:MAG: hypothetical protein KatS3mg108_1712 [Isosphaeraceae bacterium]|jgi:hypothetical protein|nr:MAG: hypothetical protein KatS3mg108_1712 [Isosphaeraceae bacterium]
MLGSLGWLGGLVCLLTAGGGGGSEADVPTVFRAVVRPEVPDKPSGGGSNPIDRFIEAALAAEGITAVPEADRRTLIRRLTFDLTGLPPTPEEVQRFVADRRPDAYERLVDRLLASPHYGERWGRHWLDVVRYAETHGYERDDPKPNAWKYRDYVIRAWNGDLPYDRFVMEQIAGDELTDRSPDALIATGMHRLGLIDDEPADPVMDRFDQLDDLIKTVGTTFLGLTIHCARCHDHKFDPIKQTDYYRLLAFFEPSRPFVRGSLESISVVLSSPSEQRRREDLNGAVSRQVKRLKAELESTPPEAKIRRKELEQRIERLETNRPAELNLALGLTDRGADAEPTRIRIRGDAHRPGDEVAPGFPSAIDSRPPEIASPNGQTTGRRLALARWLASPENPLTARVMVNRLWHYHFGRGIVGTPSDFGAMGDVASHPELLDWLAAELIERGWSLKAIQRLIVTSAAYRRSNAWNSDAAEIDPENRLLWRRTPRRLEAEAIRDAMLAVSGSLRTAMGGESVRPAIDRAVLEGQSRPGSGWSVSPPEQAHRRSVYVHVKRTLLLPELELLDAPDTNEPCPSRATTTTALQALTFLNGEFAHEQATALADRLEREAGSDPDAQIELGYWLCFSRSPAAEEREQARCFLDEYARLAAAEVVASDGPTPSRRALEAFGLVLLNANEFVTVD